MYCPNCGTPAISTPAEFCRTCGSRLSATVVFTPTFTPTGTTPTAKRARWVWPLAAAAIVAIVATGVGVFVAGRGDQHAAAAPASPSSSSATSTLTQMRAAPRPRTKTVIRVVPPPAAPRYPQPPVDPITPVDPDPYMGAHPNVYFLSPSQNIGCYIFIAGVNSAQCTIAHYNWDEPGPDCPNGAVVQVDSAGTPSFLNCAAYPPSPDSSRILSYQHSVTNGQFTCTSAETGISCTNQNTGTGFTLSREAFLQY